MLSPRVSVTESRLCYDCFCHALTPQPYFELDNDCFSATTPPLRPHAGRPIHPRSIPNASQQQRNLFSPGGRGGGGYKSDGSNTDPLHSGDDESTLSTSLDTFHLGTPASTTSHLTKERVQSLKIAGTSNTTGDGARTISTSASDTGPFGEPIAEGYHLEAFPADLSKDQLRQRSISSRDNAGPFGTARSRQTSRSERLSPSLRPRIPSVRDIIALKDIKDSAPLFNQMYGENSGSRLVRNMQSSPNLSQLRGQRTFKLRSDSAGDACEARSTKRGPLSLSDAKQALYQQSVSGVLLKRGFGGLRRWRPRFFALRGRILSYYTSEAAALRAPGRPRGQIEIQKLTRIRLCSYGDSPDRRFGIEVIPPPVVPDRMPGHGPDGSTDNSDESSHGSVGSESGRSKRRQKPPHKKLKQPPKWMMVARHEAERVAWLQKLVAVIRLIERVEEPATLRGLGSVHDHFKMGKFLGKGRFGVVRMCTHHLSGQVFAIKIINKNKKRLVSQTQNNHLTVDAMDATLQNELRILRCIKQRIGTKSPYLCNTYEVYEDSHLVCIIMEYLPGGDLFDAIIDKKSFQEVDAARITQQLVSGLASLHRAGVIHRDMKPENVLFTAKERNSGSMNVKIADFGCSLLMSKKNTLQYNKGNSTYLKLRQIVGTPGYMSPEVLIHGHYGPPCDIFAVGVILYIMLVGYPPFWGKTNDEIFARTKSGKVNFYRSDWRGISSSARRLCRQMLNVNPDDRLVASQVLSNEWVVRPPSDSTIINTAPRLKMLDQMRKEPRKSTIGAAEGARITKAMRISHTFGSSMQSDKTVKDNSDSSPSTNDTANADVSRTHAELPSQAETQAEGESIHTPPTSMQTEPSPIQIESGATLFSEVRARLCRRRRCCCPTEHLVHVSHVFFRM